MEHIILMFNISVYQSLYTLLSDFRAFHGKIAAEVTTK